MCTPSERLVYTEGGTIVYSVWYSFVLVWIENSRWASVLTLILLSEQHQTMFNQFFIWALLLSTHLDPLHAATSSQGHYGSNAIPAGNPNIPSFALTQAQTDQLPPIPPDVYADSLLPAVCILGHPIIIINMLFFKCIHLARISGNVWTCGLIFYFLQHFFNWSIFLQPLIAYKRGYATEVHRVVTPDGYILEVIEGVTRKFYLNILILGN